MSLLKNLKNEKNAFFKKFRFSFQYLENEPLNVLKLDFGHNLLIEIYFSKSIKK